MPTLPRSPLAGILFLVTGIALFAVQDLIIKRLSETYPLSEAMVIRSLVAMPLIYGLVVAGGDARRIFAPGWGWLVLRGLILFLCYASYYVAMAALPLATTVALYFSAPLMIVALSVMVLGDRVSLPRWGAVAVGFGGVLLMLRPGSALFDWAAVLPVLSGLCYAVSMVLARLQGARHSAAVLAFHGNLVFLICAVALASLVRPETGGSGHAGLAFLTRGWVVPLWQDLALLALCGVIAAVGLTLLNEAYRIAPSATVAPFEYSALLWSVIYGWAFWGDWPDRTGWTGICIITGAGLFLLLRDPAARRAPAATPAPATEPPH